MNIAIIVVVLVLFGIFSIIGIWCACVLASEEDRRIEEVSKKKGSE